MCSPDIPPIPEAPKPFIAPVARFDAKELFARRRVRDDPRSRSSFSAATFSTPKGVTDPNPNKRKTIGSSVV